MRSSGLGWDLDNSVKVPVEGHVLAGRRLIYLASGGLDGQDRQTHRFVQPSNCFQALLYRLFLSSPSPPPTLTLSTGVKGRRFRG
jgi:hypothetical protein